MKRLIIALALATMPMAGCGSIPSPSPLTVAKAEYGFEAAYNAAGTAYLAAVQNGQLKGEAKAKAKKLLGQAYQALLIARKAQALGDAASVDTQSAVIAALTVQVLQLAKGTAQ